ncbi:hypothetical protein PGT21_013767 [Puccinia graminis f. sp. tritici]|nr:hypothetical protein PGT21_013767 [Puccinia graminis f. sp. tritici]KAA1102773.1 hypothetical protein PGTUg99_035660 [Puccinia graminis f. sp. tritici]
MELSRIRELSEESSRGSSGLRGGCDSRIQEYFHGDPETYPVKAYLPEDDPSDSVSPVPSPQPKPLRNRPPSKNHGDWQWERLSELYGPNSRLGRSTSPLKNDRSSNQGEWEWEKLTKLYGPDFHLGSFWSRSKNDWSPSAYIWHSEFTPVGEERQLKDVNTSDQAPPPTGARRPNLHPEK